MAEIKNINGYGIKDEIARTTIDEEVTNRTNSFNNLQESIITLNTALERETTNRTYNDSNLQNQISGLASGSPLVASDTTEMIDTTKVYVNTTDGEWYYYDGEDWVSGGVYQSTATSQDDPVVYSKLDKQLVKQSITFTRENGLINPSKQVYAGENFEHVIIPNVTAGTKYYVSGMSTNSSYVGAFCDKPGTGTQIYIQDTATPFTDLEVTIPDNLDGGSLYVNGYINSSPVDIKQTLYQISSEFWDDFNNIKNETSILKGNICARRDGNNIYFFKHNYTSNTDLTVWFKRKAMNSLMDFYGWFTSTNTSDNVITSLPDAYSRTQILAGDTDFLAPSIVYATTNIDGDFPNYTAQKFTGGWHGYNNATSGSYSATAREISCNLYVDGKEVTNGNYKVGKNILLKIVNNLQGSNTEKEDGSGREILQQVFYISMNDESNKIIVKSELIPLESVIISRHYGISFYRANTNDYGYFLNSNNVHAKNLMNGMVTNAEKTTNGFMEIISARSSIFTMERDVLTDLGKGYGNKRDYGQLLTGGKVYNVFVNCLDNAVETDGLSLTSNDIVRWTGFYDCNPII